MRGKIFRPKAAVGTTVGTATVIGAVGSPDVSVVLLVVLDAALAPGVEDEDEDEESDPDDDSGTTPKQGTFFKKNVIKL